MGGIKVCIFLQREGEEQGGNVVEWANERGYEWFYHKVYEDGEFPEPATFQLLVILGGPQSLTEIEKYPYLVREVEYIKKILELEQHKVLGICLGHQLLGYCHGFPIVRSPFSEIGYHPIIFNHDIVDNNLIAMDCNQQPNYVYQWHEDMVKYEPSVPNSECQLLAKSNGCPVQMIRYKKNVYSFQGHPEFNLPILQHLVDSSIFYQKRCEAKEVDPNQNQYIQSADQILTSDTKAMYSWFCKFLDILISQTI